jgi:hypothetical protein
MPPSLRGNVLCFASAGMTPGSIEAEGSPNVRARCRAAVGIAAFTSGARNSSPASSADRSASVQASILAASDRARTETAPASSAMTMKIARVASNSPVVGCSLHSGGVTNRSKAMVLASAVSSPSRKPHQVATTRIPSRYTRSRVRAGVTLRNRAVSEVSPAMNRAATISPVARRVRVRRCSSQSMRIAHLTFGWTENAPEIN